MDKRRSLDKNRHPVDVAIFATVYANNLRNNLHANLHN